MSRNVIARSISFDPQVFAKMEERRARLMMQRSEYITRCILSDIRSGGNMQIHEDGGKLIPLVEEIPAEKQVSENKVETATSSPFLLTDLSSGRNMQIHKDGVGSIPAKKPSKKEKA
jgi:hypothetical protein